MGLHESRKFQNIKSIFIFALKKLIAKDELKDVWAKVFALTCVVLVRVQKVIPRIIEIKKLISNSLKQVGTCMKQVYTCILSKHLSSKE